MWQEQIFLYPPVLPALIMAVTDIRYRKISVVWLIAFGVTAMFSAVMLFPADTILANVWRNLLLVAYLFSGILLYLRIRHNRWINPLHNYIGSGDCLFVLCMLPLFSLKTFLEYLLISLLFGLAGWCVYRLAGGRNATIPLVGIFGIVFIVYTILEIK